MNNYKILFLFFSLLYIVPSCSTIKMSSDEKTLKEKIAHVLIDYSPSKNKLPYRNLEPKDWVYSFNYYEDYDLLVKEMLDKDNPVYVDSIIYKYNHAVNMTGKESVCLILIAINMEGYNDERLNTLYKEIDELKEKKEYDKCVEKAKECLEIFPFSIYAAMTIDLISYSEIKHGGIVSYGKYHLLFKGIQSSGGTGYPNIIFDEYTLDYYCNYYAGGAGYKLKEKTIDKYGNQIFEYSLMFGMDTDSFIIVK